MKKALLLGVLGYAALHWLGRNAGTTRTERTATLPGDGIVSSPIVLTTHGVTIGAPTEDVWPWLLQMGWHRGGWYTARWVDQLLFPANWPSADQVRPELQDLSVGDFIPDGPPETGAGFVVEEMEPAHHLVLHSRTHVPPGWKERFGAWIDWTWVFVLEPIGDRTRLVFRCRGRVGPTWLALASWLVLIPVDFVMARQMMHGLKARAERSHSTRDEESPSERSAQARRRAVYLEALH